ncbi:MAG: sodium/proline symporter PutP [Gammaproteobacteria bacterium]|nr:sodium/proline symporter PutP [Gammaproteobacteria bacterium]
MAFAGYLGIVFLIGVFAFKRTKTLSDHILGGRQLGSWVAALSAGASDMSGWLLLGLPGYAYAAGYEAGWMALGLLAGIYINWRFIAKPLRIQTQSLGDSLTLPEFLENRFHDRSHVLRLVSSLFIIIFFLFYTSAGLVAAGKLFSTVFGISYISAVSIGVLSIILYTVLGGFLAVSWTDLVQSLMMLFAILLVPIIAAMELGGWAEVTGAMQTSNPGLLDAFTGADGSPLSSIYILSLMAWGLGYFGQPHILARFMAIQSPQKIPRARLIAMGWVTLSLAGALAAGFAGFAALDSPLQGPDTEKVFMLLIEKLFHPVIAGILLAAILAAIMSTADSQILAASSTLTEDFYKLVTKGKKVSQKELLWVNRIAIIAIGIIAFLLALDPDNKVLDLVAYAWAGFGAAFGPAILLSLYWPRMTRNGALAGIIAGGVVVIVWKQLEGGIFSLYEIVPGFIVSTLAIVLFSRLPNWVRNNEKITSP